jgi:hypothetical protein
VAGPRLHRPSIGSALLPSKGLNRTNGACQPHLKDGWQRTVALARLPATVTPNDPFHDEEGTLMTSSNAATTATRADLAKPALPTRAYGVAAIAGPILLLLSTVAFLIRGEGINNGIVGGTIVVWHSFAMIIAFMGIARMIEPRLPRAAIALMLMAAPAFAAGVGFGVQGIDQQYHGSNFFEDSALDTGTEVFGLFALFPWGLLGPVCYVLAGILLWRTRFVPRWSAAAIVLGGILFVSARPAGIDILAVIADVTLVIGLIPVGLALLAAATHTKRT